MDNSAVQLVGSPCGQHGPYTFYKAFKYVKNGLKRLVKLSEFFFVKLWSDSDLVCIGELQLLWVDKNSEQVLSSLRLYFLPENTPEGRMDHGEDEVLAIAEKVVLRLDDLITWITADAEWTWGRLGKWDNDVKEPKYSDNEIGANVNLNEGPLDFTDIEKEQITEEKSNSPSVIILSYPSYCRYRAMMKRLEGVEDEYLKHKVVKVLGGFTVLNKNTRVLFCRDTFDYPELEGHELLCNHLAPKLKGRPRGRRKKRSLSPGSESNESESSVCNIFNSNKTKLMTEGNANGLRSDSVISPRRSTRANVGNSENKEFLKKLNTYMKSIHTPIGRIPSLGFKELDLHAFFTKVDKLGGYSAVTTNRLWKSIFDDLSGNYISTSAATVIRRHYERFLLPYELHLKGKEYKPPASSIKSSKSISSSGSDADTSESTSCSGKSTPVPQLTAISTTSTNSANSDKNIHTVEKSDKPKTEVKISSLRSVRVKPDRLREQVSKERAAIIEKRSNAEIMNNKMVSEFSVEIKSELENSSITKNISESNLLNNGLTVELITTALPTIPQKTVQDEVSDVVTDKSCKNSVTIEPAKIEKMPSSQLPSTITRKKSTGDKVLTSDDSKENVATCNTNSKSSSHGKVTEIDLIEVPCKSKTPEIVHLDTDSNNISSSSSINNSLLHSVKKRKLDILKEGGLEVTPVKPTPMDTKDVKENRPSVIHHPSGVPKAMVGQLSITLALDKQGTLTTPTSMEISQRLLPTTQTKDVQSLPSTSIMRSNTKSLKHASPNNSFLYVNGQSPPKVVQSKSIYSYSEKTVYGNPKDYFMPPPRPPPQTPKTVDLNKQLGGDILDLTTKSPQKPIVEIMRVPTVATRPLMGITELSSRKNSASLPVLDARVGSNLEITIVGSNGVPQNVQPRMSKSISRYNSMGRPRYNGQTLMPTSTYTSPHTAHPQGSYNMNNKIPQKRTVNGNFIVNKKDENGRLPYSITPTQQAFAPREHRHQNNLDYNISSSYNRSSIPKLENNKTHTKNLPQPSPNLKSYASTPSNVLPAYLSQLSMASKMVPPYVPPIDPIYYSALQSLYPHAPLSTVPPFFPVPTPDHLQFYSDLMTRNSHLRYPFPYPPDGNSSVPAAANTETNFKKQ
ncbi:hypothetical protein RN001_006110 [Aquatica leii]|uniref:ARID domain-containing protein n=1 Tax=Aquatica leii TaxID=1421715 RepID=A0AAN7PI06_9COLE|nr:hypothetical protein RN001_006110 [Aquatica leii]